MIKERDRLLSEIELADNETLELLLGDAFEALVTLEQLKSPFVKKVISNYTARVMEVLKVK